MIVANKTRGRWDSGQFSNRIVAVVIPEHTVSSAETEGFPLHEQQLLELNLGESPRQLRHPETQAA